LVLTIAGFAFGRDHLDFYDRVGDSSGVRLIGLLKAPAVLMQTKEYWLAKCDWKGFLHGCK
jgi:hypothetical protein